uniref:Uncharacterized protein n=1 Tax=Amblyomma maculatum TaxID=34609 RepID=G3MPG7_AMBMU
MKVESLIRQAYKAALGLPHSTSTERLVALGVHNTLSELCEAHLVSQLGRLTRTNAGRSILYRLHVCEQLPERDAKTHLPTHIRTALFIKPLPKNMHPAQHEGRRMARARALHAKYGRHVNAAYVDAAEYRHTQIQAFALAAVNGNGSPLAAASIASTSSETAEEAAVALAIANTSADIIFSDSKTAIRNFAIGRITSTSPPHPPKPPLPPG